MNDQGGGKNIADSIIQSSKIVKEQKKTETKNIFEVLKRYDYYISQANSKASFLIGITGVILVALISQRTNILNITECPNLLWLNNILFFLIGLGLLVSLFLSLLVVFPITTGGEKCGEYTSFIAYSNVAKMSFDAFNAHHSSETYDFWTDLIKQTHIVAQILNTKFLQLKIAVWSLLISVVLFTFLFFVIAMVG